MIEVVAGAEGDALHIHTPLNRKGNDALARVAVRRLVRDHGRAARSVVADLGLVLQLRGTVPADLTPPQLLRQFLDRAAVPGRSGRRAGRCGDRARCFARVAVTGLMLLRNPTGSRRKVGGADWGERRLYDQVTARDADFVLARQAAREVRADWCDAAAAMRLCGGITPFDDPLSAFTRTSPFAEHWTQTLIGSARRRSKPPGDSLQRLHAMLNGRRHAVSSGRLAASKTARAAAQAVLRTAADTDRMKPVTETHHAQKRNGC